jgi:BASS family bile acid:Na+ symporter
LPYALATRAPEIVEARMTVTHIAGPLVLFLLMFAVGLELTPSDFRRVLASPRAVIGGTLGQIILLPAMTFAVVWGLGLNPVFGAGAILVAISPGAGMSNVLAALGRGNVALSVTLTAMASVLAVVTLPTIASFGMQGFLGDEILVDVPVVTLMFQLFVSLLLPISLGMAMRARHPERAAILAPRFHRLIMVLVFAIVVFAVGFAEDDQVDYTGSGLAFVGAGVWTLSAMIIGWGLGHLLGLDERDRFTFLIEFSARNVAVAAIVAMSGLGRLDFTLFSGIYAAVGYPMAAMVVLWRRRRVPAS